MKTLFLMIGCPGSGKSTWIKENLPHLKGYTVVESRDAIRFSLVKEDEEYFSKENEVYTKFVDNIKNDLETDGVENVIADATHLNEKSRCKLLFALRHVTIPFKVVGIYFQVSEQWCLDHNELRAGTRAFVPRAQVKRMYHQLVFPSYDEGLDEVFVYSPEEEWKYKHVIFAEEISYLTT